jgi:hypothetical protein
MGLVQPARAATIAPAIAVAVVTVILIPNPEGRAILRTRLAPIVEARGAIADALEGIVGRRVEQLARLGITEGRCAAFVVVRHWPLAPSTGLPAIALCSQR